MMSIFSDMIEQITEVFMDDSSVYGKTFSECLKNLDRVLRRCAEKDLVLNWEKCHFMVREGIVLGHRVSERGIEVDRAKIEVIEQLPPPASVKDDRGGVPDLSVSGYKSDWVVVDTHDSTTTSKPEAPMQSLNQLPMVRNLASARLG
jgi:hypothetical protein